MRALACQPPPAPDSSGRQSTEASELTENFTIMTTIKEHLSGRVLLLEWEGPLDGSDPSHVAAAARALTSQERFLLLDMTRAAYADTAGLRWLFRLRDRAEASGKRLRIAARRGGKVWRNLALLAAGIDVYESLPQAWAAPWQRGRGVSREKRPRFGFRSTPVPRP